MTEDYFLRLSYKCYQERSGNGTVSLFGKYGRVRYVREEQCVKTDIIRQIRIEDYTENQP
jgi:hypothetical protein